MSTDYTEERRSELEVLESIFPDELTVISDDKLSIRVEPEIQSATEPYVLQLIITYSDTYPDELPHIEIQTEQGNLSEEEEEQLVMGLIGAANDSIGMAMVYTLSLYLRETLASLLIDRKARIEAIATEKARIEDEVIAIRTAGTKVTPVSFQEWKVKFEAEIKAVKKKEESDRIKAMPPKERDEYKKNAAKLSGRQLFARGGMEVGEEDVEDDVYSVDVSKYTRVEGLIQDEEELGLERIDLGDLSD